jgi:hypothetical protein
VSSARPAELIRQAVLRDGHRCSICGRPCSEEEAWRHSEAGAFGDSSMNFAAMCYGCQTWLTHEGARPAQYITHVYDRSKARLRLRRIIDKGLAILVIAIYIAYSVFAVFVMYWTPHNIFTVIASGALIFYLLYLGTSLVAGIREGRRDAASADQVRRRFDAQTLHTDSQR